MKQEKFLQQSTEKYNEFAAAISNPKSYDSEDCYDEKSAKALLNFIEVTATNPYTRLTMLHTAISTGAASLVLPFSHLDPDLSEEILLAYKQLQSKLKTVPLLSQYEFTEQYCTTTELVTA